MSKNKPKVSIKRIPNAETELEREIISAGAPEMSIEEFREQTKGFDIQLDPKAQEQLDKLGISHEQLLKMMYGEDE